MNIHEALTEGHLLVHVNGRDITDWSVTAKSRLQEVRDALQPEGDFVCDRGSWQYVRMDYFFDAARRTL